MYTIQTHGEARRVYRSVDDFLCGIKRGEGESMCLPVQGHYVCHRDSRVERSVSQFA